MKNKQIVNLIQNHKNKTNLYCLNKYSLPMGVNYIIYKRFLMTNFI